MTTPALQTGDLWLWDNAETEVFLLLRPCDYPAHGTDFVAFNLTLMKREVICFSPENAQYWRLLA